MELLLDPNRSQISQRVQAVIRAIVRRYREPEPLTSKECSAIYYALETMARRTFSSAATPFAAIPTRGGLHGHTRAIKGCT